MESIIKELWHGNIIPGEDSRTNSKEMKELLGYMARHTHSEGILPSEQMKLAIVQSGTIITIKTANGNTPFCDSASHRRALESSLEEGYAARGENCANRSASV